MILFVATMPIDILAYEQFSKNYKRARIREEAIPQKQHFLKNEKIWTSDNVPSLSFQI